MNLTEALQRWCELEPLRCSLDDDNDTDSLFRVMLVERLRAIDVELHDHGRLEYAVREAIEARPNFWDWQIRGSKEGVHYAEINFRNSHPGYKNYNAASSSSAAHALLLAYVAYLEGVMSL